VVFGRDKEKTDSVKFVWGGNISRITGRGEGEIKSGEWGECCSQNKSLIRDMNKVWCSNKSEYFFGQLRGEKKTKSGLEYQSSR